MPQGIYFDVPKMGTLASPGTQNPCFRHSALLGCLHANLEKYLPFIYEKVLPNAFRTR